MCIYKKEKDYIKLKDNVVEREISLFNIKNIDKMTYNYTHVLKR